MNSVTNNLAYKGEVTARLTKADSSPVTIHNVGYKALWDALAKAVTGGDISLDIPKTFNVFSVQRGANDEVIREQACLFHNIPFSGAVHGGIAGGDSSHSCARFTAMVTRGDRLVEIRDEAVLRMYSERRDENNKPIVLAEVWDTPDEPIKRTFNSVIDGVNAIYEWKMIFTNYPSSED